MLRRLAACAAVLMVGVGPMLATTSVGAQATAEWNIAMVGGSATGAGVTIAVVDTGVDADHFVFGTRVRPQIDIVGGNDGDGNGHGTHVAGIAAGAGMKCGDREPLAIGVAPQATILPVRVLDNNGGGSLADVNKGIRAAADAGATVINLSLGESPALLGLGSGRNELLAAITYAWNKGSIPVLAAGNDGEGILGNILFPSGYGNVKAVVVTAVTQDNQRASYATGSGSATWGIAAPGGDASRPIYSAWPGGNCEDLAGTSMAAPHVAGALAVLRSRGLSQQAAVDRILDTAAPSGNNTGAGLLDMNAALAGLPNPGSTSTTTASTTPTTAATPTTVTSTTDRTTTTGETSTTTTESTTTSKPDLQAEVAPPPLPDDDKEQVASDMTLAADDDIPGAAAVVATLGVTLVWFGWLAAVRRSLSR